MPDPSANVIVEWDASETSCINCKGERDVRITQQQKGIISYPAGVHVGTRIDTGRNPIGAGGSYTGRITMSYVSYEKWKDVFVRKYLECS